LYHFENIASDSNFIDHYTINVSYMGAYSFTGVEAESIAMSGFDISFASASKAGSYTVAPVYNKVKDLGFNTELVWNINFEQVIIEKEKGTDSYLHNIKFMTTSLMADLDALADPREIIYPQEGQPPVDSATQVDYSTLLNSVDRKVNIVPSGIYYFTDTKVATVYMIGAVSRTVLGDYAPQFTIPEDTRIFKLYHDETNNKYYNYVSYVNGTTFKFYLVENINDLSELYEIDSAGNIVLATLLPGYTIASSFGTINDPTLSADFYPAESSYDAFTYIDYRVYAQAYLDTPTSAFYTNYKIAIIDKTNNIKFKINIFTIVETDSIQYTNLYYAMFDPYSATPNLLKDRLIFHAYATTETQLYEDSAYYVFDNNMPRSSVSGLYVFVTEVPSGYRSTYVVTDYGVVTTYSATETIEVFIPSSMFMRTININIYIDRDENYQTKFGVSDSDILYPYKNEQ
jgi:hypothetical protein